MDSSEIIASSVEYITEHTKIKLERDGAKLTAKLVLVTGYGDNVNERVYSEDTIELHPEFLILYLLKN